MWAGVIKSVCLEKTKKSRTSVGRKDSSLSTQHWILINVLYMASQ